jgi:hypothetical protein
VFLYALGRQVTDLEISTHHVPRALVDDERRLAMITSILIGLRKINDISNGKEHPGN